MISKQDILNTIELQRETVANASSYTRTVLKSVADCPRDYVLVISGIRRCGKSTLLSQMLQTSNEKDKTLYLNFDTPKLFGFTMNDFAIIDEIIAEKGYSAIFFDEVQSVDGWEVYVRGKLDEGKRVVVTGSNATMLSRELGTKLTGRHITRELFPFSYDEYCGFKSLKKGNESLSAFLNNGGMPRYISTEDHEIIEQLVSDILYRDISVRYGIRDERALRMLLILLLSNVGNLVSASKLKQPLGLSSTTTVSDYFSFLQQSYLLEFVPKFSYSVKAQIVNPKKVYCIDNGIVSVVSSNFTKNEGHKLENAVYCALRRKSKEIFYFNESGAECDFVVTRNGAAQCVIQVCCDLNLDNREREVNGLLAALDFFNLSEGDIITTNQRDTLLISNKRINVIPFYEWAY